MENEPSFILPIFPVSISSFLQHRNERQSINVSQADRDFLLLDDDTHSIGAGGHNDRAWLPKGIGRLQWTRFQRLDFRQYSFHLYATSLALVRTSSAFRTSWWSSRRRWLPDPSRRLLHCLYDAHRSHRRSLAQLLRRQ